MSITVSDCLKLPTFREAQLVGGESGLNRVVTSVSVLEYLSIPALPNELSVGNELLLGGLIWIKDDTELQCRLLRHLHSMGCAGFVLYYLGIFVPNIDEKLIQTANEINFPLISMPFGRMDFRYSDVITDVMELVLMERRQADYFVADTVNRISQLAPQYCTTNAVLRLLSDQFRSTLVFADHEFVQKGAAAWPASSNWNYQGTLDIFKGIHFQENTPSEVTLFRKQIMVWDLPVRSGNRSFHLFIIDEQRTNDFEYIRQAGKALELFLNILNQEAQQEQIDWLIYAILENQPTEINRIVRRKNLDIASLHTICVYQITTPNGQDVTRDRLLDCMRWCKMKMLEHHRRVFVDTYDKYLVGLSDDNIFEEAELFAAQEFITRIHQSGLTVAAAVFQGLDGTAQIRQAYLLIDAGLEAARTIYPEKELFTESEIRFAKSCCNVLAAGEEAVRENIECVKPLQNNADEEDLLKTLSTYLLDAGLNMAQTGELLFIHKNTVNYRIHKIRRLLRCDLSQMPEYFQYYQAVALIRMLRQ